VSEVRVTPPRGFPLDADLRLTKPRITVWKSVGLISQSLTKEICFLDVETLLKLSQHHGVGVATAGQRGHDTTTTR
jgi:hypothetical protein